MKKQTFRDLIAWRKSVDLATAVYRMTEKMAAVERFGLAHQMRRAAVSIASNIAEGNARGMVKDYIHFLVVARGSLAELETQMTIAQELGITRDPNPVADLLTETDRLVEGLIRSLKARQRTTESL